MTVTESRLLVPLYVHPAVDPAAWQAVAAAGPSAVRGVVLNIADGPGPAPDPAFEQAADRLRAAGITLLGYVDTAYGRRPHAEVVAELLNYRQWYGTDGVYFDQAASHADALPHYRRLATAARAAGCATVVLGHGVHPEPAYAEPELGDLLVTFEGSWTEYDALVLPLWTGHHPATRFCHLVYDVPAERARAAGALIASRRAGAGCAVAGSGANPWGVPPYGLPAPADAPPPAAATALPHLRP
ncbi:spherulation-specific family 4 protein [Kitasatospora mediocidica]|uniref:spherulation-specific family 4 protein n=1 Tax=Kitasatospora mediocidica TaxID=58352 RepID=UPI00068B3FE3|nr:spherulation-specific family 4 protein [Kitasatospora mediocidica]